MKRMVVLFTSLLAGGLVGRAADPAAAAAVKARAYQLYDARQFTEAAAQFQSYLDQNPDDPRALLDYAALLTQLKLHLDATRELELLHRKFPRHEVGYFRLGTSYLVLERPADARKVFTELQASENPDMAAAARAALEKLREDQARTERIQAENAVFELARAGKNEEVVVAAADLEKQGPLSLPLQMQRLYALTALKRYPDALARAEGLAAANPAAVDLALVQADLLARLGRRLEAESIWRRLVAEHPGTAAALESARRLQEHTLPPLEDQVFELVRRQKHQEALAVIADMERQAPLSWPMKLQRVYSLDALGDQAQALQQAEKLAAEHGDAADLGLLRADLLLRQHRRQEAARVLKQVETSDPHSPAARAAGERLQALPPMANLDKWYWGEAYASGDYLGRYETLVGSGFVRHGTFLPEARWLQPYGEFRFGVDTRSGTGTQETIVEDNSVGVYGGARIQFWSTEYLFIYGQGGVNKDLLDRREHGDWALDYQAGTYGFRSWGPGAGFQPRAPVVGATGEISGTDSNRTSTATTAKGGWFWRGDWFTDTGANFSYYHRYRSWLGYAQAHEGFRLAQYGANVALDAYLVENLTWDVRGNYFDNFGDWGPGARAIWRPHPQWQVVLNVDWLQGHYFGRDELGTRGGASDHYDGVRVGLSVGARW